MAKPKKVKPKKAAAIKTAPRPAVQMPPASGGTIPTETAAKLLMVTPEWVRRLTHDGWIKKVAKDQYRIVDVVQGYIGFLKDEQRRSSKSAEAARVANARAVEIEMRTARDAGQLYAAEDVEAAFADILGTYRAELSGVPAASTRDLSLRVTIEKHLNGAIERCRAAFEKTAAALRSGGEVSLDGEEADA